MITAATAKSLQSCPTLCDPIPGILQARTLEWVAISFSNAYNWKVKVKSLSQVRLFSTLWAAAYQAAPSMGFSRQEYWSGVPLPSPIFDHRYIYFHNTGCYYNIDSIQQSLLNSSFSKVCCLCVGYSHFFLYFIFLVVIVNYFSPLCFLTSWCYHMKKLLAPWLLVWHCFGWFA